MVVYVLIEVTNIYRKDFVRVGEVGLRKYRKKRVLEVNGVVGVVQGLGVRFLRIIFVFLFLFRSFMF